MKGLIFTYVLCYGGALSSLFNPFVGLLIYICFAIVKPEYMWGFSVPTGSYSRIVAVALLVGWIMKRCGCWEFGRARGIVYVFLAYVSWAAIASTWAIDKTVALAEVEALIKILLPFLVGITTIDSVRKLKQAAWVIVLSHGYLAYEFNLSYYEGYNQLKEAGFGSMDNNCVAIALVTCAGMAFFLGLQTPTWWLKTLAFAALALMAHAILFSFSRGGLTALIVTGVVSFLILPKSPKHYIVFIFLALLVIRLAGPEVSARFGTAFVGTEQLDESASSRLELWSACWDLMLKNPFGVGPDQFGLVVHQYGFPIGKLAHSLWLQVGAELGFGGLAALALFYGLCTWRLLPIARESCPVADPWLRAGARMVIASLVGFAVSAQFVSLKGLEVPYYIVLIGAGVLKLAERNASMPYKGEFESAELEGAYGADFYDAETTRVSPSWE